MYRALKYSGPALIEPQDKTRFSADTLFCCFIYIICEHNKNRFDGFTSHYTKQWSHRVFYGELYRQHISKQWLRFDDESITSSGWWGIADEYTASVKWQDFFHGLEFRDNDTSLKKRKTVTFKLFNFVSNICYNWKIIGIMHIYNAYK